MGYGEAQVEQGQWSGSGEEIQEKVTLPALPQKRRQ